MSPKRTFKKFNTFVGILLCSIAILSMPSATLITYAAESTDVEVCADIKEWRYKIEDGKVYKRLYNCSTGLWDTDWIYVCDWPEGAA